MPTCPRCEQPVDSQAIACPHCQNPLKAFGHPGIPLHQATSGDYLCPSCIYDQDDTCNFPKRPHAKQCTLYQDVSKPPAAERVYRPSLSSQIQAWVRRNTALLVLIGLLGVSLLIAVL